jgi:hypothetical protein
VNIVEQNNHNEKNKQYELTTAVNKPKCNYGNEIQTRLIHRS